MKRLTLSIAILLLVGLGLAACSAGPTAAVATAQPAATGASAELATVAPAATVDLNTVADDVPLMDGAVGLKVSLNGTYIAYQVASTIEEATKFYQARLADNGWEQLNKSDSGFGDSITLLRSKPDQNISVTLQSISGSSNIRVLIVLLPK